MPSLLIPVLFALGLVSAVPQVADAREAGFRTVSIDLIYGLPGQTDDDWRRDLDRALRLLGDDGDAATIERVLRSCLERGDEWAKPYAQYFLAEFLESQGRVDEALEAYQGVVPLIEAPPPGWMMPGFEATIDDPELLERLKALGYVN